ncbi:MAG: DNA primase, partial [Paludibacter sp.]
MIDQATIDRIYNAVQIEDVVGDYVSLRKRGVNLLGLCPFHDEKTPSFTVSPAKGIFKCFGCGKGGNSVHFLMEHEQISYYEALKQLARKYNIEIVEKELTEEEKQAKNDRESMLLVNGYAQKYFENTLHKHIDGKSIGLSYFKQRGFRDDIIKKFQLGYSLDERDAFTQEAIKSGYKKEYLVKTGLTIGRENYVVDRFRGRVMFPIHSISGKVIGFGGRVLGSAENTAKYLNSPESEVYHKSRELYGIYFAKQAIVKQDRCYLVEGYTDVISMHQSGVENVVASSGTSLTEGQIRLIHRFTENVTVIYDGDSAGIKASLRGIDLLLAEGMNIKVMLLPEGEDPDSFAQKTDASDFIQKVENDSVDFIRFKCQLLLEDAGNDPIKRAKLVTDIVKSIATIPNQIIRAEYIKETSLILNVEERVLYHEINKQKRNEKSKFIPKKRREEETSKQEVSNREEIVTPKNKQLFYKEEKQLIRMLIMYGDMVLFSEEDEESGEKNEMNVGEYILMELETDKIVLSNPIFELIKNEYQQKMENEEKVNFYQFFINHSNAEISRTVVELLTQKYELSKIHSKQQKIETEADKIEKLVPRFMYEYKLAIVMQRRNDKMLEIKRAN